jgi:gliding motility-associated-like protein
MPTDTFTTGQTNVLIIGSDLSGNYDTCSFSVTIISDVTPGFANVPMDMEFMGCDAIVNWTEPDAVGFCVTPDTIYSNYMPGDTFPIGTTTVIYTAVDELGLEYTASFTITVTDPEPPVVSCPEPIVVNAGALVLSDPDGFVLSIDTLGDCSGVNMLLDIPVASDNCDSVALVQTTGPVPGEDYPIGSYTVTYLATDISGNTAECAFEVTVLPLRLMDAVVTPNPGCPGDFVTLTVDSFPGATYTWTGPQMSYPNSHQITIVSLSAGNAGLYTVQAEINGCLTPVDSVEVQVAIEPIAEDDLDFEVVAGEMLDSFYVTLNDIFLPDDAIITLLNPINGLTNFGDGLFSYDATDAAAGKVSFVYEICSETCPDLCDMATVTITVNQADCSFIPNIFTPNGDNVNDYLRIPCLDSGRYGQNSLYIYNQWGDQVFMASPYQNTMPTAWTGTFENQPGKDLPDGTYFYIFVPSPNDAPIKGFIEIYR